MNLQTRKLKMIEIIVEMDEKAIQKFESYFNKILDDSISIQEYDKELEDAVGEMERGEYLEHKSAIKKNQDWR
ncbi:hypothetical protein [Algoriphagus aquimarinus]|uniref:Uncharacterized protein n=1 Tax=Algoriphagus aquimarinus TaxID=237018 RepID=A0A5C7B263_9BACT|nr:hypothetical protein [Algoriphagus aquimarinus]TXE14063.1 hypothetical protein ESV85_00440 [Algoriphagus aquimarinus]